MEMSDCEACPLCAPLSDDGKCLELNHISSEEWARRVRAGEFGLSMKTMIENFRVPDAGSKDY